MERGLEDGSSSQGSADSSGDRMPFQTHDPPPSPTRALFLPKCSLRENFNCNVILKTDRLSQCFSPGRDATELGCPHGEWVGHLSLPELRARVWSVSEDTGC